MNDSTLIWFSELNLYLSHKWSRKITYAIDVPNVFRRQKLSWQCGFADPSFAKQKHRVRGFIVTHCANTDVRIHAVTPHRMQVMASAFIVRHREIWRECVSINVDVFHRVAAVDNSFGRCLETAHWADVRVALLRAQIDDLLRGQTACTLTYVHHPKRPSVALLPGARPRRRCGPALGAVARGGWP